MIHSPITLYNLSSINLVSIFRCSSPPRNPVYVIFFLNLLVFHQELLGRLRSSPVTSLSTWKDETGNETTPIDDKMAQHQRTRVVVLSIPSRRSCRQVVTAKWYVRVSNQSYKHGNHLVLWASEHQDFFFIFSNFFPQKTWKNLI
jgi:hypothetical protein